MVRRPRPRHGRAEFCINDHVDVLVEVLRRLDGPSLGVAAGVCRLWSSVCRDDRLWEGLCHGHVWPPPRGVRPVVAALGGYRRLYVACLRPLLDRNRRRRREDHLKLSLSLSLFCVDYYERLSSSPSSLMFLCNPLTG